MTPLRINLEQEEIPTHWYNVVADMVNPPAPPLGAAGEDECNFSRPDSGTGNVG
jgi:predicted alternative tryptophan synthase beta-subunit